MLKTLNNKKAFASIVEVIVASIIFVVSAMGVFSSIAMLRPQGTESAKKLEAAYIGKRVMDDLRSKVYGNQWTDPNNPLNPAGNPYSQTIGSFTVTYTIVDVPNLPLRKMTMNVEYPD